MGYVITSINDYVFASEIAKSIDILQGITWVAAAWREVSFETIKNCFANCVITRQTSEHEDEIVDEKFNTLFNKLTDSECDMTEEDVNFDVETCNSLPVINSDMVD